MSSQAAQARAKRLRSTGEAHFVRTAEEPRNSPVPRYGWLVQHAMIASDGIVYRAMESLKPTILQNGRVLKNRGISAIAAATAAFTHDGKPMPRRTVAHSLKRMRRKRIIAVFESRAVTSPVGTSWLLIPFTETLQIWHDDPEIFTPKNRAFFVRGKGRNFVGPEEATRVNLNADAAERNPAAHAGAIALEEPAAAAAIPSEPAAAKPAAARPTPDELLEREVHTVHYAILSEQVQATPAMAEKLLAAARAIEPGMSAEAVAGLVRTMAFDRYDKARAKRDPRPVLTVGWFDTGLTAAVHLWQYRRDQAQKATRGA